MYKRQELGDLVVLRIVGVKIVFPVKPAVLVDFTVDRQPHRQGVFHHLSVQNRKRPRHSGADRAGVGVGLSLIHIYEEYEPTPEEIYADVKRALKSGLPVPPKYASAYRMYCKMGLK